ncbi:MAG: UDP-N-acetylmuramoyl-L-alanyl-D-glutamate--2,6-diaminopimelate ligase [bacterium]
MKKQLKDVFRPLFPQVLINYLFHLPKAFLASRIYGNPSADLEIIGVTGTDGKTTTTTLIYHILKIAKKKVAMVSTIEAKIGKKSLKTGFHVTSPDPFSLQKFLRMMRSQKIRYVVLEMTSHGLDQFRFYPIKPSIAVLTNITHEHLDYHKTFDKYKDAKLKLFRHAKYAVVNKDLSTFQDLNRRLSKVLFSTYSIDQESQLRPSHVEYGVGYTKFNIGKIEYMVPLTGRYNLENTLAAISTALLLDIAPSEIKKALMSFPGLKGRFETVENDRGINSIVDFAHTPNALREVLQNVRSQMSQGQRLIVVFGSAGLRDESKRPLMGQAASEFADEIVLTAEDPRTEDPGAIAAAIQSGIAKKKLKLVHVELDRQAAIDLAINKLAKAGDWVVCAGKGHEESMCYGTVETPWSDRVAVETALTNK